MNSHLEAYWASFQSAKYACEHWHYSRSIPVGRRMIVGFKEDEKFIGVIIFSKGATRQIGSPYGLTNWECIELTRIALRKHKAPVTRMMKIAINMLKAKAPGLRLLVSYADANRAHLGKIYQAGNWVYVGQSSPEVGTFFKGKLRHRRSINSLVGTSSMERLKSLDPQAKKVMGLRKYKYLYPLTKATRKKVSSLALPYPDASEVLHGGTLSTQEEAAVQIRP